MVITEGVGVTLFGAIAAQTMPELAATFAIAGASANLAQQITGMMLHTQNSISIVQVLEAAGLDAITAGAAKVLDVPALLNKVNVSLGEKAFNYTKAFVELATLNAAIQEIEIKIGMRKSFDFKTMIINAAGTVLAAAITLEVKENTNNSDLADEIIHHATKGLLKLSVGVMMDEKTPMLFAKFLGDQAAMVANVGIHAKTKPVDYMATPQASPNDILYPQQTSFCKIPKAKQMTVANDDQYDLYKAYRSTTKIAQNEMFEASLSAKVANHSNWQAKLDQELYTHQHSAWAKGIMALAAMGSSNEMQTFTASGDLLTRDLMQFSAGHFGKKYFNDLENGTSTWSDATEFAEAATGMQMMGDIGADLIYKGFGVAKNVAGMFGGGVDVGEDEIAEEVLPKSIAKTFDCSYATRRILTEEEAYERYSGGKAGRVGRYATTDIFKSRLVARQKMALLQEWGNSISKRGLVTLPEGTVVWEGNAAEQISKSGKVLSGGATQVYIEGIDGKINSDWFDKPEFFRGNR